MARHPTLTDEEILRRARPILVERGYAVRTREIAAAVGLTWGALALRFGHKRELFRRAMLDPAPPDARPGSGVADDLRGFIAQARAELWEQWPRQLQYSIAARRAVSEQAWGRLLHRMALHLGTHAARGAVRQDIPVPELAPLVLDLLLGEVARRFVQRERPGREDAAIVEGVLRLVEPCSTAGPSSCGRSGSPT